MGPLNIIYLFVGGLLGILGMAILFSAVSWRLWQHQSEFPRVKSKQSDIKIWLDIGGVLLCLGLVLLAEPIWLRIAMLGLSTFFSALLFHDLIRRLRVWR